MKLSKTKSSDCNNLYDNTHYINRIQKYIEYITIRLYTYLYHYVTSIRFNKIIGKLFPNISCISAKKEN